MADQFTPVPVKGLKTNNNAAPTNDNVATVPAVATDSNPSYTEGNEVKTSIDLNGATRVRLQDSAGAPIGTAANPLVVEQDASPAGTHVLKHSSIADLASGATDVIASDGLADGTTSYLEQITVSSSIRTKAIVELFDGNTVTELAVLFTKENGTTIWKPADKRYVSQAGNVAADATIQVRMTNLDNLFAADVYATIEYTTV